MPALALIVFVIAAMRSNLNLGIRHFLLVYPLIALFCGRVFMAWEWRGWKLGALIVAGVLQVIGVVRAAPDFLPYLNQAAGGGRNALHYFSDGDYGQDLTLLGRFARENPGAEMVLSYFGTAVPEYYGINAQYLMPTGAVNRPSRINSPNPPREFLAVSLSHLQGHMAGESSFEWLRARPPEKIFGGSIYVFDITRDAESHEKIASLYRLTGETEKAVRHERRAGVLGHLSQ